MRLREYNYREGEFTYGARIAVGEIWQREGLREYERLKLAWREMYGYDAKLLWPLGVRVRRLIRLREGLEYWFRLEADTLKAEPTAEQLRAGIRELGEKIGEMGTIKALAKDYHVDPDEVLQWPWGKVYGILLTDLEEHKYNERLTKVVTKR